MRFLANSKAIGMRNGAAAQELRSRVPTKAMVVPCWYILCCLFHLYRIIIDLRALVP